MRSFGATLASVLLSTLSLPSNGSCWADEVRPSRHARLILEHLKDVGLTDDQEKVIGGLTTRFEVDLADAEKKAAPAPAQRTDRERAVRDAIAKGKKGADARPMIAKAYSPTEEQRRAASRMKTLVEEFERAVFAVLTEAQQRRMAVSERGLDEHTGYIIIRLNLDLPPDLDASANLLDVAKARRLDALNPLRDTLLALGLTDVRRLVRHIPETQAGDADMRRELDTLKRRLRSYWRIDARSSPLDLDEILRRLRAIAVVELAYKEQTLASPALTPNPNPHSAMQGYLDPAPCGVDARYAWTKRYGEGQGVGLVDVERDWNLYHEDLAGQAPALVFGDVIPGDHGTGVLGSIVAENNKIGVVGVAPSPAYVFASSYAELGTDEIYLAEAIVVATTLMNCGDVMLLEVALESGRKPVELSDPYYDAIRYATLQGIVVVEAAGNGGHDLDATTGDSGRLVLNKASAYFRDSGAIFIGGSDPRDAHNRRPFSCYGSRVDCFAWGGYVVTCGGGDLDDGSGDRNKTYRKSFNGTSSAAAIVAGAAMVLQARIKGCSGTPATPARLRSLLSDPRTGTPQGNCVPGRIGVMPNLRAIMESAEMSCPGPDGCSIPHSAQLRSKCDGCPGSDRG